MTTEIPTEEKHAVFPQDKLTLPDLAGGPGALQGPPSDGGPAAKHCWARRRMRAVAALCLLTSSACVAVCHKHLGLSLYFKVNNM